MTDEEFHQILDRYLNGTCTPEESMMVESLYQSALSKGNGLSDWAHQEREQARKRMLSVIRKEIRREKAIRINWNISIYKVAASILIISTVALIGAYTGMLDPKRGMELVEVPAQKIQNLTLPDGSQIELSPGSRLWYPDTFNDNERIIFLEGQSFIKVVHDESRPFKVYTGSIETTVLGTEFTLSHLPGLEKVEVALFEGKVAVEKKNAFGFSSLKSILSPGEWLTFSPQEDSLIVMEGITKKGLWREGIIHFEGSELSEIGEILEDWYQVPIEVEGADIQDCLISGSFSDESLENILKSLQFAAGIEYKWQNESVNISGGKCQ